MNNPSFYLQPPHPNPYQSRPASPGSTCSSWLNFRTKYFPGLQHLRIPHMENEYIYFLCLAHAYCVIYYSSLFRKFVIPMVRYSEDPLFRRSDIIQEVRYPGDSLLRRFVIPNIRYSEGSLFEYSLFWKFVIPTVRYSGGSLFRRFVGQIYYSEVPFILEVYFPKVRYSKDLLFRRFVIPEDRYSEGSLFRRLIFRSFVFQEIRYSEGSLFWRIVIPKVRYSRDLLFRRSVIPEVRYSEGLLIQWQGFVIEKRTVVNSKMKNGSLLTIFRRFVDPNL